MAKRTGQPGIPAGLRIKSGARAGFVAFPLRIETSIGRMKTVDVFVPDLKSSRQHCMVLWDRGHWLLLDLSSNGTYLNGQRVERTTDVPLKNNDVIRIGQTEIEFRLAQVVQPAGAETAPAPAPPPPPEVASPAPAPVWTDPLPLTGAPAPGFFPIAEPGAPAPAPARALAFGTAPPAPAPAFGTAPPALATAGAEVEYEFDFGEDTSPSLDKVFEEFSGGGKDFTSTATQAFDVTELRKHIKEDE